MLLQPQGCKGSKEVHPNVRTQMLIEARGESNRDDPSAPSALAAQLMSDSSNESRFSRKPARPRRAAIFQCTDLVLDETFSSGG